MDIENKDIALGALLIGIVVLAGWVGFLYVNPVTKTKKETDEETEYVYLTPPPPPKLYGLPEDWSTAPNATSFMFYNQTGAAIEITLEDILDGVALYYEQEAAPDNAGMINEYKKVVYPMTVEDPISGQYVTGVNILDILQKYDTNFGWDISFISSASGGTKTLDMTTGTLIKKCYAESTYNPVILALAINQEWIHNSSYVSQYGNFSIIGAEADYSLYFLNEIRVTTNWTVAVNVNGTTEFVIDPNNITVNEYTDTYRYDRSDYWGYNRIIWGRNISDIIDHTSANQPGWNYTVRIWSVDNWATPATKGSGKAARYNNTQIKYGIKTPFAQFYNKSNVFVPENQAWDYINKTDPDDDWSGVPMFESHIRMMLMYKEQELGETDGTITDPVWPYPKSCGYSSGPFHLVIPGRPRNNYGKWVTEIDIISYDGPIPSGYIS